MEGRSLWRRGLEEAASWKGRSRVDLHKWVEPSGRRSLGEILAPVS